MQFWCRYQYGFVNLDDEFLYLNNSGNWSDTHALKERSAATKKADRSRSIWIKSFLYPALLGLAAMLFVGLKNFKILFLVLAPVAGIAVYRYMKPELGPQFRIPRGKISSIMLDGKNLELEFTDGEGAADKIILENIAPADLMKLREILLGGREPQGVSEKSAQSEK